MTEEQKEKYANFLNKVSEILGLNRPVDILRLCAVTDEYFQPIEKRIAELEKENAELKEKLKPENCLKLLAKEGYIKFTSDQLAKAKGIIKNLLDVAKFYNKHRDRGAIMDITPIYDAEQFLKEETE